MSPTNLSNEPLVKVVISAFNAAEGLSRAVASVLNQTYRCVEIVVLDDSSCGRTSDDDLKCSESIRRQLLSTQGLAAARNAAIRHGSSELIALLDGNDAWTSHKLERSVRFLQQHPECDVVYTPMAVMDMRGERVASQVVACPEGWILDELFAEDTVGDSSAVFHRRVWERLGGFDESLPLSISHNFWLRVAVAHRFGLIREPLTLCSMSESRPPIAAVSRALRVRAEMLHRFYEEQGGRARLDGDRARHVLGQLCQRAGWLALRAGDPAYSARLFRGATIYRPGWLSRLCFTYADWRRQQAGQPTIEMPVLT